MKRNTSLMNYQRLLSFIDIELFSFCIFHFKNGFFFKSPKVTANVLIILSFDVDGNMYLFICMREITVISNLSMSRKNIKRKERELKTIKILATVNKRPKCTFLIFITCLKPYNVFSPLSFFY